MWDMLVVSEVDTPHLALLPEDLVEGLVEGRLGVRFCGLGKFRLALRTLIVSVDSMDEVGAKQSGDLNNLPRTESRD